MPYTDIRDMFTLMYLCDLLEVIRSCTHIFALSFVLYRAQEEEEEEEAQMKARAWADWADDHEKGAGNKNYRR